MKKRLLLFFLMLIQTTYSQELWNQFDDKGNRHGKWKQHFDNGAIRYQGEFFHGKEIGTFKFYAPENANIPEVTKEFIQNSDRVKVQYFYPDGNLKSEGQMQGKERIGKWSYFFKDGKTMMSEENYQNGLLTGDYKIYYFNNTLTEWSNFKNGLLHGLSKRYTDKGVLVEEINYSEGKLNGDVRYYDTQGVLILKGTYLNDRAVGAWEAYENGQLKEVYHPNKKQ